jgi:hypothetical protein
MYGQSLHLPWQTNWPQQTSTNHVPLNGAPNLSLFGYDQSRMAMEAGSIQLHDEPNHQVSGLLTGLTTDVDGAQSNHHPSSAVRTSGFQETNGTNHELPRQALSSQWRQDATQNATTINAAYDQALHSSLAQFGDGTTQYDNLDWNNLFNVVYDDFVEELERH